MSFRDLCTKFSFGAPPIVGARSWEFNYLQTPKILLPNRLEEDTTNFPVHRRLITFDSVDFLEFGSFKNRHVSFLLPFFPCHSSV